MEKIQYIKTYSADIISKFTNSQIQTIIDHFAKPDIEFTDDSSDVDETSEALYNKNAITSNSLPEVEICEETLEERPIEPEKSLLDVSNDRKDVLIDVFVIGIW